MTSQPQRADAGAKVQIICETRKYLWNYLQKSEISSLLLKENGTVRVRTWLMKKGK